MKLIVPGLKIQELAIPVEFPVNLNGEEIIAKIISIGDNGYDTIWKMAFSDGYCDLFALNDKEIKGKCNSSGPYAQAIASDANVILPETFIHVFQHDVNGIKTNIWIHRWKHVELPEYSVSYNGYYQLFFQRMDDQWFVTPAGWNKEGTIDIGLAKRIGFVLDAVL